MNKSQKILIAIAIVVLDLFLVAGACYHAYANYASNYHFMELLFSDPRPYIAIVITVIVGFFLLKGKNGKK
jgi:hypothetical protein